MIKKEVKEWIGSLSGFQGGNPEAEIWVCGLEYQDANVEKLIKGKFYTVEDYPYNNDVIDMKEGFNQNLKKLVEAYYDKELLDNIFAQDGKLFKLNLYPLSQASTSESYDEDLFKITGIRTKSELRAICLEDGGRFENFRKRITYGKKPKVIIGCSRSSLDSFLLAFAEKDEFFKRKAELEKNTLKMDKTLTGNMTKSYSYCKLKSGVYLFVIPFISSQPSAVKSAKELCEIGKIIRNVVDGNK